MQMLTCQKHYPTIPEPNRVMFTRTCTYIVAYILTYIVTYIAAAESRQSSQWNPRDHHNCRSIRQYSTSA